MMTSMVSIILGFMLMIVQNPGYINKPAAVPDPIAANPTDFERERSIFLDHVDNITHIDETKNGETTQITTEIPLDTDYSKLNQYSRFDNWGLGYDKNGNLTQKSTQKMYFDYKNRMVRVTEGTAATENKYDALGRRLQKIFTASSQTKAENYYYSGQQVVEVRDGNDQVKRQLIYGNGIDEVIRMDVFSGSTETPYFFHTNEIGSTTAVTDANGQVVERYKYGLYGMPTFMDAAGNVIPKSTISNNILFQGREYEPETNFYYFRARHLDPIMGRFLQVDPMGYQDSLNLYQAFNMNPVNFTDPFGKDVLGSCAESYKYYLNPTENKEIIEAHNRALALVGEGAANAAVKTFLLPAKYITLPLRLMFGFDFDVNVNFTRDDSVIGGYFGKQNRLDIVKEQTVVYPLADFVTQTGYDAYFGLSYQGGNSSLGKSSRENLGRTSGALGFNMLFWGKMYSKIKAEAPNNVQPVDSVWKKGPGPRGEAIEKMLGQNLPQNYPTIDRFDKGVAISIKSMDLTSKSLLNPKNLLRTAKNYIDQVANFQGARWARAEITANEISKRRLDLAIPRGVATSQQKAVLNQIIRYGKENNIQVNIIEVY